MPGKVDTATFINMALTGYTAKLIIAIVHTPAIYAGHAGVKKHLGAESDEIIKRTAEESLQHKVEH